MSTIVQRVASGVAVLALAFATVAGAELPAATAGAAGDADLGAAPGRVQRPVRRRSDTCKRPSVRRGSAPTWREQEEEKEEVLQGCQGPGLRSVSWGSLSLRRHRTQRLGLLGVHPGCLEHAEKIPRTSQGQSRYGKKIAKSQLEGDPRLLLLGQEPRRHLRRQGKGHPRLPTGQAGRLHQDDVHAVRGSPSPRLTQN